MFIGQISITAKTLAKCTQNHSAKPKENVFNSDIDIYIHVIQQQRNSINIHLNLILTTFINRVRLKNFGHPLMEVANFTQTQQKMQRTKTLIRCINQIQCYETSNLRHPVLEIKSE